MFEVLEKETFESAYLKELQDKLSKGSGVSRGVKQLNSIGNAVNLRYNQILYIIACGVLMWNYHCAEALERWKGIYGNQIRDWFESIGEFEALISLTVVSHVKENTCFPVIKYEDTPRLKVEEVYHPLIAEKKCHSKFDTIKFSDLYYHRFKYVWKDNIFKKYRCKLSAGICRCSSMR